MNVSPYLYNNRVKILKGLISYVRCVGFNLEKWGTTKGFLSVSWRDQSCPRKVALDTAESGLERGKSGKSGRVTATLLRDGGQDQADSNREGGKYMNQQDLMFGFKR